MHHQIKVFRNTAGIEAFLAENNVEVIDIKYIFTQNVVTGPYFNTVDHSGQPVCLRKGDIYGDSQYILVFKIIKELPKEVLG